MKVQVRGYTGELREPDSNFFWRFIGYFFLLAVAFFTSILDLTLGRQRLLAVQPTVLALSIVTFFTCLVVFEAARKSSQGRALFATYFRVLAPFLSYFSIAITSLVLAALPEAVWREKGKWIFLNSYGFLIWAGTIAIISVPTFRKSAQRGVEIGYLMLTGSVIYEIFYPGSFSNLMQRAAGFAGNANFGALSCCILCSAVLKYHDPRYRLRDLFYLTCTGVAVIATQSRSGLGEYSVILLFWGFSCFSDRKFSVKEAGKILFLLVVFLISLGLSLSFVFRDSELFAGEGNRMARLLSGKSMDDGSSDERVGAAMDAMNQISEAPILGHGTGFTRTLDVMPHNQYLQQWVNNGMVGLAFYLLLLLTSLYSFYKSKYRPGQTFIAVVLVGSLFSHNLLDQRTFIFTLAILLGSQWDREREG